MKKASLTIVLMFLLLASACMSGKQLQQKMDSWIGSTKNNLYLSWGPPTTVTSDGAKGEIVVYSQRIYSDNTYNYGNGPVRYRQDYYVNRMFYINEQGIVYSWRTSNTPNPPQQVDVNVSADVNIYHNR